MTQLPEKPYILVMFGNGLTNISWVWGLKFIKRFMMDDTNLNNIVQIFSVHDSWFVKTLTTVLNNYNLARQSFSLFKNSKDKFRFNFNDKQIINCGNLYELNNYVDITKLKISLNVYKHDYALNKDLMIENPRLKHPELINNTIKYHFYQIYHIIYNFGDKVQLIFHKPGNKISSEIFINCIKRDQVVWINDWNLYCIATSFKKLLGELPVLLPLEMIPLPIKHESLYENFHTIIDSLNPELQTVLINVFKLLFKLIQTPSTKLNSKILSRTFSSTLSHQPSTRSNETNTMIVANFIRMIIDNWDSLGYNELHDDIEVDANDSYEQFDITENVSDNLSDEDLISVVSQSPTKLPLTPSKSFNRSVITSPKTLETKLLSSSIVTPSSLALSPTKLVIKRPSTPEILLTSLQVKVVSQTKRPVIRGIRVSELAKLYEERCQGLDILKSI